MALSALILSSVTNTQLSDEASIILLLLSLFGSSNFPVRSLKKKSAVTVAEGETKFNFWVGNWRIIHEQISSKLYDLLNFGL